MSAEKRVLVGGVAYVIQETAERSIAQVTQDIENALIQGTLVKVPVLSDGEPAILYLHGGRVDAVVVETGVGPDRPGEIGP